jgi:hypothetical protein
MHRQQMVYFDKSTKRLTISSTEIAIAGASGVLTWVAYLLLLRPL